MDNRISDSSSHIGSKRRDGDSHDAHAGTRRVYGRSASAILKQRQKNDPCTFFK